ncbi:MAG: cobalamin-dependent protein [Oscillospiraceae bacterium]|nr:cobalamin-dependent protein [Oscillospiraceae bacterium]
MSKGAHNAQEPVCSAAPDLTKLKPYGDTMGDGKVQISFALPVRNDEKGVEAAIRLAKKMGVEDPSVASHIPLDSEFTMYIIYGCLTHSVDYTEIHVSAVNEKVMNMEAVENYIRERIGREVIFVGASTGTDAHTVGIDAIINRKGLAGHYGLERYEMVQAYNLGSQVSNEEFVRKARELRADVLLVSQTVTQKDIHIQNLTELIELLEAEGVRQDYIIACGGPRISNELAKELGFDAGFGPGKFAEDVATFAVVELAKKLTKA